MAYIEKTDLKGLICDDWLDGAMDDDKNTLADPGVWDSISSAVDDDINGRIAGVYAVPVLPVPPVIRAAARAIACWLVWKRYGTGDSKNPWNDSVKSWREKLDRIGKNEDSLTAPMPAAAGAVISAPAKTHASHGGMIL